MAGKHELVQLRDELSVEIGRDAPHIANMVFGDAKNHPDVAGVPNERIDEVYRQKYQSEDRQWLQAEARRDPEQFLKVTQRIGVRMPDPNEPPAPSPMPAPLPVAPPMPPAVPPPVLPVAPVVAPSLPSAPVQGMTPSPVILGPNGMPLPPSGVM